MLLKDKAAVVTGAGSGIGQIASIRIAKEGAAIGLMDMSEKGMEETRKLILEAVPGAKVACFKTDVTKEEEVKAAIEGTVKEFGKLNVALNCAGITAFHYPIDQLASKDWETVMRVNLFGSFYCAKYEITEMLKNDEPCSVVFISSTGGIYGFPCDSPYNCSKHGVIGLMRNVAVDYAEKGIRSNAICPSQVDTAMNDSNMKGMGMDDEMIARFKKTRSPSGRLGKPEEVAAAIVFLMSEQSSHINGTILNVDGGQYATNMSYFG